MCFHQDFGVGQVPHQVEVRYSDRVAPFSLYVYLRTIRFSFSCGTSLSFLASCRLSNVAYLVQEALAALQHLGGVCSRINSYPSISYSLSRHVADPVHHEEIRVSSLGSFFLGKPTEKGVGGKEFTPIIFRNKSFKGNRRSFAFFNSSDTKISKIEICATSGKSSLKLLMTSISNLKCFYRVVHSCAAIIHVAKKDLFQVYKKSIRSTFFHVAEVFFLFFLFLGLQGQHIILCASGNSSKFSGIYSFQEYLFLLQLFFLQAFQALLHVSSCAFTGFRERMIFEYIDALKT